jgi:hypothetical protein
MTQTFSLTMHCARRENARSGSANVNQTNTSLLDFQVHEAMSYASIFLKSSSSKKVTRSFSDGLAS